MSPLDFLPGYKTYILAWGAILATLGAWMVGDMALGDAVEILVASVMAMTLRKAIK